MRVLDALTAALLAHRDGTAELRHERHRTLRVVGTNLPRVAITDMVAIEDIGTAARVWRGTRTHRAHLPGDIPETIVQQALDAPGTPTGPAPVLSTVDARAVAPVRPAAERLEALHDAVVAVVGRPRPVGVRLVVQAREQVRDVFLVNTSGARLRHRGDVFTSLDIAVETGTRTARAGLAYPSGAADPGEVERVVDGLITDATAARQEVRSGIHNVVCDAEFTGLLAHEIVAHALEADVPSGISEELPLGHRVCDVDITIVDDPRFPVLGRYQYDEEGTPATAVNLITAGTVTGRMHTRTTASGQGATPTGHGRTVNWRHLPIARSSATYVAPGRGTAEDLAELAWDGLFLSGARGGGRGLTFTVCARAARRIRRGRLGEHVGPVCIAGSAKDMLAGIAAVGESVTVAAGGEGGCGKADQFPLPVAAGGPPLLIRGCRVLT